MEPDWKVWPLPGQPPQKLKDFQEVLQGAQDGITVAKELWSSINTDVVAYIAQGVSLNAAFAAAIELARTSINDVLDRIGSLGIYARVIPLSTGGTDGYTNAVSQILSDTADPNRPPFENAGDWVAGAFFFVGGAFPEAVIGLVRAAMLFKLPELAAPQQPEIFQIRALTTGHIAITWAATYTADTQISGLTKTINVYRTRYSDGVPGTRVLIAERNRGIIYVDTDVEEGQEVEYTISQVSSITKGKTSGGQENIEHIESTKAFPKKVVIRKLRVPAAPIGLSAVGWNRIAIANLPWWQSSVGRMQDGINIVADALEAESAAVAEALTLGEQVYAQIEAVLTVIIRSLEDLLQVIEQLSIGPNRVLLLPKSGMMQGGNAALVAALQKEMLDTEDPNRPQFPVESFTAGVIVLVGVPGNPPFNGTVALGWDAFKSLLGLGEG